MADTQPFFASDANLAILRSFRSSLSRFTDSASGSEAVARHLERFIDILLSNAEAFDRLCTVNIAWIGRKFMTDMQSLSGANPPDNTRLLIVFASAYRFISELDFCQKEELGEDLRLFRQFADDNLASFPTDIQRQIIYANYVMPSRIAKHLLHHPNVTDVRKLEEVLQAANQQTQEWKTEIEQREKEATQLRNQLDEITATFNFVGLVDGFKNLEKKKSSEKLLAFWALIALGLVAVAPLVYELYFVWHRLEDIAKHKDTLIFAVPALLALEVLLIYFFRVVLAHFRSLKAQLLQLQLRMALCQFIQSYADYAAKIRKQDANALEKFESLVFSGLSANEDSLPTTFDGTEQLAKLVKSLRGGA